MSPLEGQMEFDPELQKQMDMFWETVEMLTKAPVPEPLQPIIVKIYEDQFSPIRSEDDIINFAKHFKKIYLQVSRIAIAIDKYRSRNIKGKRQPQEIGSKPLSVKAFNRRLRIVAFIANDLTFLLQQLKNEELWFEGGSRQPKRISWIYKSQQWNQSNPNDQLSPESLKREYLRARKDPAIRAAYWAKKRKEMFAKPLEFTVQSLMNSYREMMRHFAVTITDNAHTTITREWKKVLPGEPTDDEIRQIANEIDEGIAQGKINPKASLTTGVQTVLVDWVARRSPKEQQHRG